MQEKYDRDNSIFLTYKEKFESEEQELKKLIDNLNKCLEKAKEEEGKRKKHDKSSAIQKLHDTEVEKERLLAL